MPSSNFRRLYSRRPPGYLNRHKGRRLARKGQGGNGRPPAVHLPSFHPGPPSIDGQTLHTLAEAIRSWLKGQESETASRTLRR